MDAATTNPDATPMKDRTSPPQPSTTARLLTRDVTNVYVDDATLPLHHKDTFASALTAPPPLSYVARQTPPTTNKGAGTSAPVSENCTPKRHTRSALPSSAVPPLHVESLTVSAITSGGPSPLSQWSNRTEKHAGPTTLALQQTMRPSAEAQRSACCSPKESASLLTVVTDPSQTIGSLTSPVAAGNNNNNNNSSSSAKAASSTDGTLQPDHADTSTPASTHSHASHDSLRGGGDATAPPATSSSSAAAVSDPPRRGASCSEPPSFGTPATTSQTPEKWQHAQDLSPFTVSSTSVGGTVTPTLPHVRGAVWLCDVSRDDDDNMVNDEGTPVDVEEAVEAPTNTPQHHHRHHHHHRQQQSSDNADLNSGSDLCDVLDQSDSSVHRSLFPHATAAYISAHPSGAPFSSPSTSAFSSPLQHPRESHGDKGFGAQYPLFQPQKHSPCQAGLLAPPAQATPSHTELLTDVFAESATSGELPLRCGRGPRVEDGLSPIRTPPDLYHPHHPRSHHPNQLFQPPAHLSADAPIQLSNASPARSLGSHGQAFSSSSGGAEMDTQVFQSGTQVVTPTLRRACLINSHGMLAESPAGSVTPRKLLPHHHFSSPVRVASTPAHPTHVSATGNDGDGSGAPQALLRHLLDDTSTSTAQSRCSEATVPSSPHTPRNVSDVMAPHRNGSSGSNSDSIASSPLPLASFDGSCGAPSLSLSGAGTGPAAVVGVMENRAGTPTSPHTPVGNRTPGISGLHGCGGNSYAAMSEHSVGVSQHRHCQLPSQPMTPQKSARRNYSRQTTPSQSFRSKVQSHSFESQQQQQQPFLAAHPSGLWSVKTQANTSVSSVVLGETTAVAERDYLAPSRNPFSLYRSLETYTSHLITDSLHASKQHLATTIVAPPAAKKTADDSSSSEVTQRLHSAAPPLREQQTHFITQLTTATMRPDAAVVLYEQLIPAPSRLPGGHRRTTTATTSNAREATPSHAALDLLLHARARDHVATPGSLSLSLSGRCMMGGPTWGTTGAAVVDHRTDAGSVDETSARSAASVSGRTVPHKEVQLKGILMNPTTRPRITLANCSPRQVGPSSGSPPHTPNRRGHRHSVTTILDTPDTDDREAQHRPSLFHPRYDASPRRTSTSASITPLHNSNPQQQQQQQHQQQQQRQGSFHSDPISLEASTSMAARNLSMPFTSPDGTEDKYRRSQQGSASTSYNEDGEEEDDDPSPPPRRPTTRFDYPMDTSDSVHDPSADSPVGPDRALQFGEDDTDQSGEDEVAKGVRRVQEKSRLADAPLPVHDVSSPTQRQTSTPLTLHKELSAGTPTSSAGSPMCLGSTVANVKTFDDGHPSSLQLHLNLQPPESRTPRRQPGRTAETTAVAPANVKNAASTLPPSISATPMPFDKLFDFLKSPDRPHPHLRRQITPPQESPAVLLSTESLRLRNAPATASTLQRSHQQQQQRQVTPVSVTVGRLPSHSNNDVASLLSPSAYQALGSVLDTLETTDTSVEEEIAGDRFQAHHEFQFLHYVEAAVASASPAPAGNGAAVEEGSEAATSMWTSAAAGRGGAGRPIPLTVEVNGVTWLATHRLNGLPYAVKEVPAVAFNAAELQCLTLSNRSHPSSSCSNEEGAQRAGAKSHVGSGCTPEIVLEAEDYLARYYSVSTPPQDSAKPVMHLLQLEYFPRGSVHNVVHHHRRSNTPDSAQPHANVMPFDCAFWEQVVQQGLRGLRALHHAHLLHGCPLPCSLFLVGHTASAVRVKWSCFGSARQHADVYPTESLPAWLSEAVSLLYKQRDGPSTAVLPEIIEVAVFCLGVLELLVEDAEERHRQRGILISVPAAAAAAAAGENTTLNDSCGGKLRSGLRRLEWIEEAVQRFQNDGQTCTTQAPLTEAEAQLHSFMRFLWNAANSYRSAEEVLAQMCDQIDPARTTVEELYEYEIDRLTRLLRQRAHHKNMQQRQQLQVQVQRAQTSQRRASQNSSPPSSDHDRVPSLLSQPSLDLPHGSNQPSDDNASAAAPPSHNGTNPLLCSPDLGADHGLVGISSNSGGAGGGPPSLDGVLYPPPLFHAQLKSPQLFPRRASTASSTGSFAPRPPGLDVSAERQLPLLASVGAGQLFLPHSTASAPSSGASAAMLSLRYDRPASEASPRGIIGGRRGRAEVHPRVREAAQSMLRNALSSRGGEESVDVSMMWQLLLRPAVHALRLRGWMSLYAGVPLAVTGDRQREAENLSDEEEEEELLVSLLMTLRPITSFE